MGEADRASGEAEGVMSAEGILLVLPLFCSITPPAGEGGSLQQVVGGIQW